MPPARAVAARVKLRADIQGLRALAVAAVVVFHLIPDALPGGYVGVDVFFVISGFLITSHLVQHPPSGIRAVASFWGRRARRLLPASLLVLAVTLVAARLVSPSTQWENTARMVRAAALYVVNWTLASDSVDYLAAGDVPTAVQHYWSLSVEEQFYFVWPILVALLVVVARVTSRPLGRVLLIGFAAVLAGSLTWSIVYTGSAPDAAYFVTPTRIWELAVGGVLATWYARRSETAPAAMDPTSPGSSEVRSSRALSAATWAGLAAIASACLIFDAATRFPGYAALLPVLGTAAVIAGRPSDRAGVAGRLLSLPPMQWLGGISYSVYLWHWPLIVLVPYVSGGELGLLDDAVIVVLTLVLAQATTSLVENPARRWRPQAPARVVFAVAVAGMALVLAGTSAQLLEVRHRGEVAQEQLAGRIHSWGSCLGAASLDRTTCPPTTFDRLVLGPDQTENFDKPQTYSDVPGGRNCEATRPTFRVVVCGFGDPTSKTTVWLVGNSHAGHWLPAIDVLAKKHGWRIETHIASGCIVIPVETQQKHDAWSRNCLVWAKRTIRDLVREHPDLVVLASRIDVPVSGQTSVATSRAAYDGAAGRTLRTLHRAKISAVVIRDTPLLPRNAPDCVDQFRSDLARCDFPFAEVSPGYDPFVDAANTLGDPNIHTLDLDRHLCHGGVCPSAVGGLIVYFDQSHLSATYSRTLAPYLDSPLVYGLRRGQPSPVKAAHTG